MLNTEIENTTNSLSDDLLEFLNSEEQKELGISENTNTINSKEEANYFIKKVKEMQLQLDEIHETAKLEKEKQIDRITAWEESKASSLTYVIDRYMSMLRDFWTNYGDNKTMKLSYGSLCMRKMKSKTAIDEDKAIELLSDYNILEPFLDNSLSKSAFRDRLVKQDDKYFIDLGNDKIYDVSNCVTVTEQEPKFEIK